MLFFSFALVIVFFAATFAARTELKGIAERSNKILNKNWVNVKPALRSNSESTSYTLIAYEYLNSATCGNTADVASGFSYNTCFVGYDEAGKVLGSGIYRLASDSTQYAQTTYTEYSNGDCTGTITYQKVMSYPKSCTTDSSSGTSVRFETMQTSNIFTELKGGFLISYFDTQDHCDYNNLAASNSLTWINYNSCLPTSVGQGVKYVGCSNGQANIELYYDAQCTNMSAKAGVPLPTCEANDQESPSNDSGFYYRTLVTEQCL